MSNVDIDRLRDDLEDYFGTAMFSGNPQAMIELEEVKRASAQKLISIAQRCGFNINKYIKREEYDYYR